MIGSVHGQGQQVELQTEKLQSGPAGLRRPAGGENFGDFQAFEAIFNAWFAVPERVEASAEEPKHGLLV